MSPVFDGAVVAVGFVLGIFAVAHELIFFDVADPKYFLAVPLIMLMGWFPMLIGRAGGGIEIGLEACVLIFLAVVTTAVQAEAVWFLGCVGCQLLADKRASTKLFNIGIGAMAGGIGILAIEMARSSTPSTPRELLAAGLGAAIYFTVDFSVSAVSLSLEEDLSISAGLRPTGALGALVAFLGIASLGYLAALVFRDLPEWSAFLLAVPISTILVASRAQSRGSEHARRLKILLDTAVRVQTVSDRDAVMEALTIGASDLLRDERVRLRTEPPSGTEIGVAVHGSGEELWVVGPALNRARSTAGDDRQGLTALVAVAEDAFARLRLSEDMAHLAWHDPLTGLPNRSLFMDRVEHAMELQVRRGGQLAVLFCDLDGFKRVNDLFGHAAGDELLYEVGARIKSTVRTTDTVARLGGDEFAVLLEEVQHPDDVGASCERILSALRRRIEVAGEAVSVTTTIGVALSKPGDSADALLSQADLAMYHAKGQGKDRYETYRLSFGDERLQRIELVETLRRAIETKHLEVFYQPVVDLQSEAIRGVEALVRWRRDGVLVPPDLFIPTAEESGLIVGLGALVLEMVAEDAPRLRAAAGHPLSIGVNISPQQLHTPAFEQQVHLAQEAMGDTQLVLELTERDFVSNDEETVASMTALAAAGVNFAIDDFGVGFSAIGYLQRLPVSILKVDRSFLTHIEDDPKACSLVRSMVVMGEALGLDVVIEGVEREGQLQHVIDHAGGAIAQGFFFGRPLPIEEAVEALSASPAVEIGAARRTVPADGPLTPA
ncbi:MAG: EAL domain-containing protein [Nocardioidaceae bacterium]